MRRVSNGFSLLLVILVLALVGEAQNGLGKPVDNNGKALTQAEQEKVLFSRAPSSQFGGTFSSYGSLLFAASDIAIHTESSTIGATSLGSPFPVFYLPTWREIFDSIAQQTKSNWKYDASRNYWDFSAWPMVNSYSVTLAKGWNSHDDGIYVGYTPPTYPVGMDIYRMGSYSATTQNEEAQLFEKVRDSLAIRFATPFKQSMSVKDMKAEQIDGVTALYFEADSPSRKNVIWRQWAFVSKGKAFVIVSTLDKSDAKLLEDVTSMVKSFQVR